MIGYILNELWTLLSWYVMECTLFGVYVLSKGAEKTRFSLKMIQLMRTFHINLDLNRRGSREGHKPLQLGNLLFQIFVNFQTRALTHKKKKKAKKRSVIPKSICELNFTLFSFSSCGLINIQLRC